MKSGLSAFSRQSNIERMHQETFDLVIIGGGITGAGVARDAVSRGMKVALVEAHDFASGTSSRSSKLIHGGIRYLENLEFHLVFEALSERRILFDIAPHLVHPLRFIIPLFKGGRVGMFKMGLGMWLYDALSMFEAPELHERLSPRDTLGALPFLTQDKLQGAYSYFDAYMDDDRLVIETLRSASQLGAVCANYIKAESARFEDGQMRSLVCRDQVAGKRIEIRGRHFVSTVGPWTDEVGSQLLSNWKHLLRPSKGVHLTFSRERFPLQDAVVMGAESRIVFGIPRHEMVIVGTTDTDYPGNPSEVTTTPEDVRYLLDVTAKYFPGAKLKAEDILASYAGVRPLVYDGAETESKTSREHLILNDSRGITFVTGGKYTTYRKMAEQTLASILPKFPIPDQVRFNQGNTKVALNSQVSPEKLSEELRNVEEVAVDLNCDKALWQSLVLRFGSEAHEIVQGARRHLGLGALKLEDQWCLESWHSIHETMCLHLNDFLFRRTPLVLSQASHGNEYVESILEVFTNLFSLSKAERDQEINALKKQLEYEFSWRGAGPKI